MDHLRHAEVAQHRTDEFRICDVALHDRSIDHRVGVTEFERVDHHHLAAGCSQRPYGVRSDVAGAAGDEDRVRFLHAPILADPVDVIVLAATHPSVNTPAVSIAIGGGPTASAYTS